jgi:DNA-binding protein YbaB
MLDDLMGNLEKQQAEIQKKLSAIVIEVKQEGLTITGNAAKQVTNVVISNELIDCPRYRDVGRPACDIYQQIYRRCSKG